MPGINVNQITSMLAKLPDQSLQQYAAMHKDNPYVVSLAVAESNRRKDLRSAGAMQAGAQPQPKVADAAIAEMVLPEEQGIGRLPAPNMQGMADGGIVGYAEGGEVERYQSGGKVPLRTTTGGKSWFLDVPETMRDPSVSWYREIPSPLAVLSGKEFATAAEAEAAYNQVLAASSGKSTAAGAPARITPTYSPDDISGTDRRLAASPQALAGAVPSISSSAKVKDEAPAKPAPTPMAPSFAGLNVGRLTEEALNKAAAAPNPFAADVRAIGAEKTKAAEENVAGLEAIQKQFSDIFKGRRERLDTREAELGKLKEQTTGLALLMAGAEIASTAGPLGTALGKGVKVGTQQYAAGMEKLQAAKEKLADARDRLEEVEAQRNELSARELYKARVDAKNMAISAREDLLKSNMQMYGINRDTAMKVVDNQVKVGIAQLQEQGATNRANIAASAQKMPGEAQMAMMLGTGATDAERLRSGLAELAKFKSKDGTPNIELLKQFVELKKTDPSLTPEGFLSQAGQVMLPTTSKPPPNSVVRTQPGR